MSFTKDPECIFCKIANGEIPTNTVFEDDDFRVILDLNPATKGHALVLPKYHFRNIYDMDEEFTGKAFKTAKKIALAMKDGLGCEGVNIIQNNEEIAGQSVFHFHIHVIPRYTGDGQKVLWKPGKSDPEKQAAIAETINKSIE
ncbi:MAG: HIT family protein [Lachnospiraceae bacterium]|nr:HIT family protein [Lachnospiraceae bacterium]